MFLSIDAGNSNIVFSLFDEAENAWTNELRINTQKNLTLASLDQHTGLFFLELGLSPSKVTQIGLSSVVPELNATLQGFCKKFFGKEAYLIKGKSYRNLPINTKKPDEIGSDLMANAMAAFAVFHQACIIVDFGTALTFTVVDNNGQLIGVNIVPGIKTALKSLAMNTAKLPEVKLEMPKSVLGQGTVHSIQAGILYGYTGLVNGMLDAIIKECEENFSIVATGGLSTILTTLQHRFNLVDPYLTVEGIRLITKANQKIKS
ncbi:type III pantothenate kinase [Pleomorphovibrio marinus]|uniref:type III pantothenate kinase n=1 Tax=Pleomorphovibrio marinus TaxID=2164132 RepID=UPI000E0B6A5C|nr:type III pantothenate kinase [Pleomorphovibrio marinus]